LWSCLTTLETIWKLLWGSYLYIQFYFALIILSNDFGLVWLIRQLSSEWEATRIEALHWISTLINEYRTEVTSFF
jgi:hypothetical protein